MCQVKASHRPNAAVMLHAIAAISCRVHIRRTHAHMGAFQYSAGASTESQRFQMSSVRLGGDEAPFRYGSAPRDRMAIPAVTTTRR
jgi:hypothetical protein